MRVAQVSEIHKVDQLALPFDTKHTVNIMHLNRQMYTRPMDWVLIMDASARQTPQTKDLAKESRRASPLSPQHSEWELGMYLKRQTYTPPLELAHFMDDAARLKPPTKTSVEETRLRVCRT